jgi:cytochrome c peroxidase
MAKVQLGKSLPQEDVKDLLAFLQSLTGKLPDEYATPPILPVAGFQPTNSGTAPPK